MRDSRFSPAQDVMTPGPGRGRRVGRLATLEGTPERRQQEWQVWEPKEGRI